MDIASEKDSDGYIHDIIVSGDQGICIGAAMAMYESLRLQMSLEDGAGRAIQYAGYDPNSSVAGLTRNTWGDFTDNFEFDEIEPAIRNIGVYLKAQSIPLRQNKISKNQIGPKRPAILIGYIFSAGNPNKAHAIVATRISKHGRIVCLDPSKLNGRHIIELKNDGFCPGGKSGTYEIVCVFYTPSTCDTSQFSVGVEHERHGLRLYK